MMTTDTAAGEVQDHRQQKKVIAWLAEVFKLNPQGLNWGGPPPVPWTRCDLTVPE